MKSKLSLFLILCLMASLFMVLPASAATVKLVPAFPTDGNKVTVGFTIAAPAVTMSDSSAVPADITFSWSPKAALEQNADGSFTAKKTGTVTITAKSATLGSKANGKCKLKVLANQVTGKVWKGDGSAKLFFSIKKIYFKGANMYFDVHVYNGIGKRVSYIKDFKMVAADTSASPTLLVASFSKSKWTKSIASGKTATVTLKGPRLLNGVDLSKVYDLRNPAVAAKFAVAAISGDVYGYKGIESKAMNQAPQSVLQLLR